MPSIILVLRRSFILGFIKKLFGKQTNTPTLEFNKISASHYKLTSDDFSPAAVEVVLQLQSAGFQAFIVGGGVRDLLLGFKPKDFDVATNAKPEEVKKLFRQCYLVGRRFRLAHVRMRNEIVEVATFRAEHHKGPKQHGQTRGGMIVRDNIYGNLEDDAVRRDFTINSLYYDPTTNTILDYTGGLTDLEHKELRIIGEAKQRYREDPVRILRAIRLANKLELTIEAQTAAPIAKMANLLSSIPPARLTEETQKLFLAQKAWSCLETLERYSLFQPLFPLTAQCIHTSAQFKHFLKLILENSERRLMEGKTVNYSFLMAAFLWEPVLKKSEHYREKKMSPSIAFDQAAYQVLKDQSKHVLIIRRHAEMVRDIWRLQYALENRRPRLVRHALGHPALRAAYDFLLLRTEAGEPFKKASAWWTEFMTATRAKQDTMLAELEKSKPSVKME
jgi:poly(A) polymerase